jgi:hypothetical protein
MKIYVMSKYIKTIAFLIKVIKNIKIVQFIYNYRIIMIINKVYKFMITHNHMSTKIQRQKIINNKNNNIYR